MHDNSTDSNKQGADAQSLLAAIVESSDDAIVSKTLEGRILSWNKGAERLFGYSAAEAVGQSITILIPLERLSEEDVILSRLRRGERIDHYETVRVAKDGRRLDISVTISPVRDTAGRIVAASKVARDVTARKRAEADLVALKDELATQLADLRRLQEMSTRLSTTLELQPILEETLRTAVAVEGTDLGILSLCDPEHNDLGVGASIGFSEEFLRTIERIPSDTGACGTAFKEQRRIIVEDIETDPIFAAYRDIARAIGFRAVHSTPLVTRQGRVVGVLSVYFRRPHRPSDREMHFVDVCARQAVDFIENAQLYTELREADRSKDEFLAILAHELRNPLAPVRNAVQLLREQVRPVPETAHSLDLIDRQMGQMTRLIDDLLDISRITRNKLDLRKERVTLADVVRSAVETCRPLMDTARHEFTVTVPSEPVYLNADATRLAQALSNLLNNAAKYTERGGHVWLTAERQGSDAVVTVRDTGIGIPPAMLPKVFEMFIQVDRSLDKAQGGLGIGLTLVKRLVEMHGGSVTASSEGPGCGSAFTVRLPVIVEAAAAADPNAPEADQPGSAGLRVLVVDDNRDAAVTLAMLLRLRGNETRTAFDGLEAVAFASDFRPDVIIMDIGLPKLSGYDAARRLRLQPWARRTILIAVTGWGQDEDRRRSADAGFDHHLVKPVEPASLFKLLSSLEQAAASAVG